MLAVQHVPLTYGGCNSTDLLSRRGRSRQVSRTAIARQASQERRTSCALPPMAVHEILAKSTERSYPHPLSSSMLTLDEVPMIALATPVPVKPAFPDPLHSISSSSSSPSPLSSASMSPDHYNSPPSPPRSLEDQVHEAYALEDIHLAKILLLRLKGIEVTSDDDPRIAAVQDEDFDFCFLPNGPLLSEQDELALKELQDRERRRIEELRRVERMKQCERKWIEEKQRMRDQRVAELRRRERKRLEEEEQRRRASEEERRRTTTHRLAHRTKPKADRKVVNYDHLLATKPDRNQPFVYDIMVAGPSSFPPRQTTTPPLSAIASTRHVFPSPTFDDSRAITFKDVLKSMEGQLFPLTDDERSRRNLSPSTKTSRSRTSSRLRQARLLDALLAEVEYTREERRNKKGKAKECRQSILSQVCPACSASRSPLPSPSPTTTSLSSSPVSRTSSWMSFCTSSSLPSSSSNLTTPSSSPMVSRKPPWLASRPQSWIQRTGLQDTPPPPACKSLLRHSCRAYHRLTPVSLSEGPLVMDVQISTKSSPLSYEGRQRNSSRVTTKNSAGVLVKRVSRIVELAKGFQSAYVTAALFSVTVPYDEGDERHSIFNARTESDVVRHSRNMQHLRPSGSRVSVNEVKAFLTTTVDPAAIKDEDNVENLPPKYIPLISPFPLTEPPRTILPDPLPYKLVFKPIPQPIRSPFRCHANPEMHTMYPPACSSDGYVDSVSQLGWRIRAVGNPVHLRLKALKNIGFKKGLKWEISARDTSKGSGKERLLALTYEGIGRSNLSYSSSVYG